MTSIPTSAGPGTDPERAAVGTPPTDTIREGEGELPAPGSAPEAFLFSAHGATLRAAGVHSRVPATAPEGVGLAARATMEAARAAGHPTPMIVGAVGFAAGRSRLVVPERVQRRNAPPVDPDDAPPTPALTAPPSAPASVGTRWDYRAEPPPPGYAAAVHRALERIRAGEVEKVVLARSGVLTAPQALDVAALLERLVARNPSGYGFGADVTDPAGADDGPRRTLVGASPELLVARRGRTVTSHPLAGTAPRSPDPAEDERRRTALAASSKDHREHALVVERVAEGLAPFCSSLEVPAPDVTRTAALWHLGTRITGTLRDPAPTALELAEALHPTPAVCGEPTEVARAMIAELEGFPRDWYSGLVGWCDADGDGEWAVAIRCAEVAGREVRVYAGAGVVEGSRPEAELAETSAKFRTLLAALGLESTP